VPTYEYRCKDCGQELEVVQSFTDDSLTTCEACGGSLRKVFGNVGIAFKGSGFYKNDSRGKASTSAAKTDKADASSGNGSSGEAGSGSKDGSASKTESTPAAPSGGDKAKAAPAAPAAKPA
jgi:putative FmdB family regulatory protein